MTDHANENPTRINAAPLSPRIAAPCDRQATLGRQHLDLSLSDAQSRAAQGPSLRDLER